MTTRYDDEIAAAREEAHRLRWALSPAEADQLLARLGAEILAGLDGLLDELGACAVVTAERAVLDVLNRWNLAADVRALVSPMLQARAAGHPVAGDPPLVLIEPGDPPPWVPGYGPQSFGPQSWPQS